MTWGLFGWFSFRRADWRDEISAYLDDELSPRERARVEARLAESAEMQDYLADLEQMRTVLRGFEPSQSATPFQISPEMLDDPARISARPAGTARALRLSMSTAALGVATFAAVMVFDAVDSPTVNFTTTSADAQPTLVPTAAVVTDEVEVQAQAGETSDEAASPTSSEPESVAASAQDAQEEEEPAAVAAVASEHAEQQEAAQEAVEQEEAEQQAEAYQEEPTQQEAQEAAEESTADPSRRALTAGRSSGAGEAKSVNVEDVVAEQEEGEAAEQAQSADEVSADAAADHAENAAGESHQEETQTAAESPVQESSEERQATVTQTETRSVATSVAQGESDWPLEQRPRSTTVQLARDPSWELPVQIVLAAVAISSAVFWLVLTIADRRRRA